MAIINIEFLLPKNGSNIVEVQNQGEFVISVINEQSNYTNSSLFATCLKWDVLLYAMYGLFMLAERC